MPVVRTSDGTLVQEHQPHTQGAPLTPEQAEASVSERNARAEEMGIEARYVVAES